MKQRHLLKVILVFVFLTVQATKAADSDPQYTKVEFCFGGKRWYLELDEKAKCADIVQVLAGFVGTRSLMTVKPSDLKFFIRPTSGSHGRLRICLGKDDCASRRFAIIGRRGMALLESGENKVYIEL